MSDPKRCRICGRQMKSRTATRPSDSDKTCCQNCAHLMWALHGKRPAPRVTA